MNKESHNFYHDYEHTTLLQLFEELPLKDKFRKVVRGLKSSPESGDYKYARLQILRISSPVSAILVPLLLILLLINLPAPKDVDSVEYSVKYIKPKSIVPDDKLDPVLPTEKKQDEVKKEDNFSKNINNLLPNPEIDLAKPGPIAPPNITPSQGLVSHVKGPVVFMGLKSAFGEGGGISDGLGENGGNSYTENAVSNALRWLVMVQEEDGSWRQESGGGPGKGAAPAMTGLALLTFLAHGETTADAEFGETILKGLKWLVKNQKADGTFNNSDKHNYCLPIASYALCEAYGLTPVPAVKEAAQKSIKLIVDGQNDSGGWDYNCKKSIRNDISYMGWCAQALKAAKLANVSVEGLDNALTKSVAAFKKNASPKGGFGYVSSGQSHLTGAGVLCLQMLGHANDRDTINGLMWLQEADCKWNEPWGRNPLYNWYYVTQAKFRASGKIWNKWNDEFANTIVNNQTILNSGETNSKTAGYWQHCSESEHCKSYVYNTTLCTLMLEVYYRNLLSFKQEATTPTEIIPDPKEIPINIRLTELDTRHDFDLSSAKGVINDSMLVKL